MADKNKTRSGADEERAAKKHTKVKATPAREPEVPDFDDEAATVIIRTRRYSKENTEREDQTEDHECFSRFQYQNSHGEEEEEAGDEQLKCDIKEEIRKFFERQETETEHEAKSDLRKEQLWELWNPSDTRKLKINTYSEQGLSDEGAEIQADVLFKARVINGTGNTGDPELEAFMRDCDLVLEPLPAAVEKSKAQLLDAKCREKLIALIHKEEEIFRKWCELGGLSSQKIAKYLTTEDDYEPNEEAADFLNFTRGWEHLLISNGTDPETANAPVYRFGVWAVTKHYPELTQ
ncbi:hypothetical protein BDZ45DRAFT_745055 [Acephala macrosclerotiorum]|nr:hypothetical protein BDZ45DRAFT_745055 [Acephala macrosclerotiorum]